MATCKFLKPFLLHLHKFLLISQLYLSFDEHSVFKLCLRIYDWVSFIFSLLLHTEQVEKEYKTYSLLNYC